MEIKFQYFQNIYILCPDFRCFRAKYQSLASRDKHIIGQQAMHAIHSRIQQLLDSSSSSDLDYLRYLDLAKTTQNVASPSTS